MNDLTSPKLLLKVEGLLVFLVAILMYRELGASWWMFALLFLVPDVSMLGYFSGAALGAVTYNVVHTYAFPIVLFSGGLLTERSGWMAIAIIWAAHIGFDRVLGFGLKYPEEFWATHFGRV
jgi:Domain of unknown function (DUF4260)